VAKTKKWEKKKSFSWDASDNEEMIFRAKRIAMLRETLLAWAFGDAEAR